jgi:PilZ domain
MQAGLSPARQPRVRHRHELRALTYVMLDQANGGILRNLTREGVAVQAVAAVPVGQKVRVRFELPSPRLRVESQGEVLWSRSSGQCGIRFVDLPPRLSRRIDEWIFGDLLGGFPLNMSTAAASGSRAVTGSLLGAAAQEDGLLVSPTPVKVIELPPRPTLIEGAVKAESLASAELDWLSQPLSTKGITWAVNTLAVVAAVLLFVLVFLSVNREPPRWPVAMLAGAALFMAAFYWGFFKIFGGGSPGARLARLVGYEAKEKEAGDARFR